MPNCGHCDSHVTEDFVRVFCQDQSQPEACPSCATTRQIIDGAAHDRSATWESRSQTNPIETRGDD